MFVISLRVKYRGSQFCSNPRYG